MKNKCNLFWIYSLVTVFTSLGSEYHVDAQCAMSAPEGLVSWWTADQTANDLMGVNNGTLENGVTYILGEVNYAFSFDGTDQYVLINSTGSLTGAFTVELWAMPMNQTNSLEMFGSRDPGEFSYDLSFSGTYIHSDIGDGGSWITTSADVTYPYVVGNWYHIAETVTTTNYVIYVNGSAIGSGSFFMDTPVLYDPNHQMTIGYNNRYDVDYMNGPIDDVRIYNRALSANEIQGIYLAGTNGMCAPTPLMFTSPPICNSQTNVILKASLRSGQNYLIEANTNLLSTNWITITNLTAGTTPITVFTNVQLSKIPKQFYRIVSP